MYVKYVKRLLDFSLALLALVVLSPLMLTLAVLVRIKLGSPVLFRQARPGKREKLFVLCKFRSMSNKTDADGKLLPDSERMTEFEKKLRRTSLDELPELWNILRGDMSIVGPRPLAAQYLPYYNESERRRHDVRPGLTGLAQINGRNAVNWPDRFRYDIEYVDHLTFKMDAVIVYKTVLKIIKRDGVEVRGTTGIVDFDEFRRREQAAADSQRVSYDSKE